VVLMASYILTDEEITAINQQADMYIERASNYAQWAPIRTVPNAYKSRWNVLTRFEVPRGSIDGRDFVEVQTARTVANADLISYRYKFNIPFVDVDSARRVGQPIWSDNIAVAAKQMDYQIAHLICEGTHSWDPVAINGLRDGGTENANDGSAWNTVTKPEVHAAAGWGALETAGFTGPYTWVMSSNLGAGIRKKYGAGDPMQLGLIKEQYEIDNVHFLPIGTSTRNRIYPIAPADADDGVWFMFPNDSSVWRLAQTAPPQITIKPEMNMDTMSFEGWMHWRGTVEIVQATGIQYDPDVDLA
jgi:hypothetical protein